jgi:hypothetical protein
MKMDFSAKFIPGGSTIIPVKMDHNHHGDDRKAERKQLRVAVKRKEVDDIL